MGFQPRDIMKYKMGDEVVVISNDDIPEIKAGVVIDTDFTVKPPTYAIICHGNNIRVIAESIDISQSYDDLQERYLDVLKNTQQRLQEQIQQVDSLIQDRTYEQGGNTT